MKKWQWMGGIGVIRKGISVRFEWYKIEGSNDYGGGSLLCGPKTYEIYEGDQLTPFDFAANPWLQFSTGATTNTLTL